MTARYGLAPACVRALALGAVLLAACKSASTGGLPTWEDPDPDSSKPVAAADDVGDAEPDPASEPAADDTKADDTATPTEPADAGAAADSGAPPDTGAPTEPPPATAEPAEALALPDPVHKKIEKKCGKDPGVGEKLKAFELATTDGGKVTQGTFRGRVLVVNFWGTWCKPCLKELPEFDQLYRRYRKHGMTLLAIATDEDATPVNEFKKKRRLSAKLAIGGEDYAGKYGSEQFPFTFVVDTKGVIKSSYRGYKPECMGKLEDDIRKELEKRAQTRAEK